MNGFPESSDSDGPHDAASPVRQANAAQSEKVPNPQTGTNNSASNKRHQPGSEEPEPEPELALEPDLPSDGRDQVGEAMIRDLPPRPELGEPPSHQKKSRQPN